MGLTREMTIKAELKIEDQLSADGSDNIGVDHDNKMVLWYDENEDEYNINGFSVDQNGVVKVDAMPTFNFRRM